MKKLTNKINAWLISLSLALVPLAIPVSIHAQTPNIQQGLEQGSCLSTDQSCDVSGAEGTVNDIIATVINIFSLIVGVVSVIMIIVGGLKYITSGGDSGNVSGAKNTILYAIVGLVIVALAQVIVKFVLNKVSTT
ncbi:MAG: hypothetical protein H6793_01740 [Candidatus Nomurabacteria bacterium]|nr:MAG: hypothetical protein H6793_01740 [Candidatus Nomurabacteria bacterium]